MNLYVKTLRLGGVGRHNFLTDANKTKFRSWPLPQGDAPGDWLDDPNPAPLQPHRVGINLAPFECVLQYISTENYLAEADGETAAAHDCVVAKRVRLLRLLPSSPQDWRTIGLDYAQDALATLRRIDHVRPYLEHNLSLITGPYEAQTKAWGRGAPLVQVGPMMRDLQKNFEMQMARFAYDIPSSGLYTGPATAALQATRALNGALALIGSRDSQHDHADQVKTIAYQAREAAAALADDYVEHRGRTGSAQAFAAQCGVDLQGDEAPDDFARQVRRSLFRRQNDRLREMWNL